MTETLEQEFQAYCISLGAECKKLDPPYRPTGFIRMMHQYGAATTARRLLESGDIQTGFSKLVALGRVDLTVEYAVLQPRWEGLFTDAHREAAQWRITQAVAALQGRVESERPQVH